MRAGAAGAEPVSIRRVAFASCVGATVEWYDFFLYGVVAPLVFNKLFFPNYDPLVGTLLAYGTFFVGFVSRPVGGVLFGHFGDRIGRKSVLVLTLLIMGVATVLIGCLPTYETIGVWAPILLLVLRVCQGLGIGGEWGGAVLMAVEHAPRGRRGFYGSWPQIGVPAGLLLSSGIVALLSFLPDAAFLAWGWRIAFLLSAVLVAVGLYIRVTIFETPAFAQIKESGRAAGVPFLDLLRTHRRSVLLGLGARYIEGVAFNTFGVYSIAYVTGVLGQSRHTALTGVSLASAIMIATLPLCGLLSDRFGRRAVFAGGAILIGLVVFPAFALMDTREPGLIWLAVCVALGLVYPLVYGPQAALFSELFDTRVRYSGISFVYQFSGIFASGLTPIIATELVQAGGKTPWYLAGYVAAVSLVSAACVAAMAETHRRDMSADSAADRAGAGRVPAAGSLSERA